MGAKIWQIRNNPAWNSGVESAENFLLGEAQISRYVVQATRFTKNMTHDWGIRVFLTEADAQKAIKNWKLLYGGLFSIFSLHYMLYLEKWVVKYIQLRITPCRH